MEMELIFAQETWKYISMQSLFSFINKISKPKIIQVSINTWIKKQIMVAMQWDNI